MQARMYGDILKMYFVPSLFVRESPKILPRICCIENEKAKVALSRCCMVEWM